MSAFKNCTPAADSTMERPSPSRMDGPARHGGIIRRLLPSESAALHAHLMRLDPESRHDRFGMGVSDDCLKQYAARSASLDDLIYGFFVDGELRGAGELRGLGPSGHEHWRAAEAAFSVETDWQGRGYGSKLMASVILAARNRRVRKIYMNCLASNGQMQRLARRHGAELEYEGGDVVGLVLPEVASPVSYLREAVSDGYGWATAVVDLQKRSIAGGLFNRAQ